MRKALSLALFSASILAGLAALAQERPEPHVFDFEDDADFDQQPDYWQRKFSRDFRHYLTARLSESVSHTGKRSLEFVQNGGGISYRSREFPVSPGFDYRLEAWVKAEGLEESTARVRILWLDAFKRELASHATPPVGGTTDWTKVEVLVDSVPRYAAYALIDCVMEGKDINGYAWFDSIAVAEHPKLSVGLGTPGNLVAPGSPRVLVGKVTGLRYPVAALELELLDYIGRPVWSRSEMIKPVTNAYEFAWQIPSGFYGYFTAKSSMAPAGGLLLERRTPLVLPAPLPPIEGSSKSVLAVDVADSSVWLGERQPLLRSLGVSLRVELGAPGDPRSAAARSLLHSLAEERFSPVAVLPLHLLSDSYQETVRRVVREYGGLVDAWQVGSTSESVGSMEQELLASLRALRELTHPMPIGLPAAMAERIPSLSEVDFVVLRVPESASPDSACSRLADAKARWHTVWVELPVRGDGAPQQELQWLAETTLGLVRHGAGLIFVTSAGEQQPLFDYDIIPTATYLAWRNLNGLLSGASYAGALRLPGRSQNMIFRRGDQLLLACWNSQSSMPEPVDLGEEVEFCDIFGQRLHFPRIEGESQIRVGGLPVFATKLDRTIIEMTLAARQLRDKLYSKAGEQPQGISVTSRLRENLACVLDLWYPPGFAPEHRRFVFDLGPDETYAAEAPVTVPRDVVLGNFMLRALLQVSGRRPLTLELQKEFAVVSDIEMKAEVRRKPQLVEVFQEVTNNSDSTLQLVGLVGSPGELPIQSLPARMAPGGKFVRSYSLPAESVKGKKLWIAVRELDGIRFVNRFVYID